jgi:hypothetical protein
MSDWRTTDDEGRPVFSDDRLLAYVLGLDDDPELQAAALADEQLRRRLDEVRAEMAAVDARLQGAAPDPGASYADPLDARWSQLHEFFAPPAAPARRRRGWLKVLAPAAAVAVALAVGVGVVVHQNALPGSGSSAGSTAADATGGRVMGGTPQESAPRHTGAGAVPGAGASPAPTRELQQKSQRSLAKQAERFAVVVVARAGAVTGGRQQFTVLRALKGRAPHSLALAVVSRRARAGALNVLFLEPVASPSPSAAPPATPSATPSVTPSVTPSETPVAAPVAAPSASPALVPQSSPAPALSATPLPLPSYHHPVRPPLRLHAPLSFRFHGAHAVVRRLPAGLDVAHLRLS